MEEIVRLIRQHVVKDVKDIYITSPYRKLFTPDLNVFLYTKVIYLSFISFISDASERIRVTALAGCSP